MKTYIKVLGILSLLTTLTITGILAVITIEEDGDDRLIAIALFIPLYFIFHFLIANRFGFNYKQEDSKSLSKLFIISSIASFLILLFVPMHFAVRELKQSNKEKKLELEFSEMKDWGVDTTAYSYYGKLRTKYFENDIMYQLNVKSEKPFKTNLTGFKIELLDKDGFKIKKISINDYSRSVDDDNNVYGISSNSNSYMPIEDYSRIENWTLLVTTEN